MPVSYKHHLSSPKWSSLLSQEFDKDYFKYIERYVNMKAERLKVYPKEQDVFKALELTDYDKVKVVILGQDPYFNGEATGLSFANANEKATSPTLLNVFKEIERTYGSRPKNNELIGWASQGILLLNSVLTVTQGMANSHQKIGWEIFTDYIVHMLNEREIPVVFILWGRWARKAKRLVTNPQHLVIEGVHPSPLAARWAPFIGCNHFKECNDFLEKNKLSPIDWTSS